MCEKYKTNFRVPESANWLLKPAVNGIVFSEFVYNEATYLISKEIGIDYLQGFYIGKPSENLIEKL